MTQLLRRLKAEGTDPSRWADVMHAFEMEDAACSPPSNAIVFTGSSSITFWRTLQDDMAPLTVLNRGFGGSTMQDVLYWLDTLVIRVQPRAVVVYEGDNELGLYGGTPEKILEQFSTFAFRIRSQLPESRIYPLSIKPSPFWWDMWAEMRRANDLIRAFCETGPQLHFIEVGSHMLDDQGRPKSELFEADGLHLSVRGYGVWTSIIRRVLLAREDCYESAT
jgi:lysophospholipase L1-like esterase